MSLAVKQANTTTHAPEPTSQSDSNDKSQKPLEGGMKLADIPTMDQPSQRPTAGPPSPLPLASHDDDNLKKKIESILNDANETCESKSSKIMSVILQHRRSLAIKQDRETIPPANARFLHGAGISTPNHVHHPSESSRCHCCLDEQLDKGQMGHVKKRRLAKQLRAKGGGTGKKAKKLGKKSAEVRVEEEEEEEEGEEEGEEE